MRLAPFAGFAPGAGFFGLTGFAPGFGARAWRVSTTVAFLVSSSASIRL